MRRRRNVTKNTSRSGLTKIEVVVVMLILMVFAALLLPATQRNARDAARRVECQNNMKNIVIATVNLATRQNRQLPDLYEDFASESGVKVRVPWTMSLLHDLDLRNVRRAFEANPREVTQSTMSMRGFACPLDSNNFQIAGGLSYVANTGFMRHDIYSQQTKDWQFAHGLDAIDWNQDGVIDDKDQLISRSTGVFWPRLPSAESSKEKQSIGGSVSLDFISSGDGQSSTILFSENMQGRTWNRADAIHDFAFGVPVRPAVDFETAANRRLKPTSEFGLYLNQQNALPGMAPQALPGTALRPSSNHLGVSIYGFADGSAKQISDSIDWRVYVGLLTPNGRPLGEEPLSRDW